MIALVEFLLPAEGVAKVPVSNGELPVEFDGLAEAGNGFVQFIPFLQGFAEVVVGGGLFGTNGLSRRPKPKRAFVVLSPPALLSQKSVQPEIVRVSGLRPP